MKNLKWKALITLLVVGFFVWEAFPLKEKINLGLDLQGGMHLALRVDTSELPDESKKDAADRALEVIRNRIDQFGVREPIIQRQGKDNIIVQLPGITDRNQAINLVRQTAHLEFKLVSDNVENIKGAIDGNVPAGFELKQLEKEPILIEKEAAVTGDTLVAARIDRGNYGEPTVAIEFNSKGATKFAKVTRENVGKRLAIVLDDKVISAPVIREPIPSGQGVISGRFSPDDARLLAISLRAGALPAPIIIEEERTVGPTLGSDSIRKGVRAALVGAALVVGFIGIYYLLAGFIADLALCLNILIIIGALSYFKATLTLPGIGGIALTIGMAVDANVLIYERIREELKLGKSLIASINSGFKRAVLTIFDSNLTTLIIAVTLFWFGTGPIRGFATTLTIGLLANFFTAIFVTRLLLDVLSLNKGFKRLPMLKFIGDTKINFIGKRKFAYTLSILLIGIGLLTFAYRGQKNFGIDFTGGLLQEFEFSKPINADQIRQALKEIGLGSSCIQRIKDAKNRFLIRSYTNDDKAIENKFKEVFKENKFDIIRIEKVGPVAGEDLRRKGLMAIFVSLIGILIYVSFRFEFKFAVAGIVALLHDTLFCLGALAITRRELSLPVLASLLTIIGYSINDTIVIFDRVREDLKLYKKDTYENIINVSINQTLSRTFLTSLTTLFTVLCLFIFGGEVINDFAFVLLVGVIVGSYSTVFVASPLVVDWHKTTTRR